MLPLDKARAHQLELPALKKYDYSKYDVVATGVDITSVDINTKITLNVVETEFGLKEDVVLVPKEKILSLSDMFFVTIKDDEGMAHSL